MARARIRENVFCVNCRDSVQITNFTGEERNGDVYLKGSCVYMANWHSSGDWQFKQSVAMALPTVILKAGWLRCWAARFLPGCVAR